MSDWDKQYQEYMVKCRKDKATTIAIPCFSEFWTGWRSKWCRLCEGISDYEWGANALMYSDWHYDNTFVVDGKEYDIVLPSCAAHHFDLEYKLYRLRKCIEILQEVTGRRIVGADEARTFLHDLDLRPYEVLDKIMPVTMEYQHWQGKETYYVWRDLVLYPECHKIIMERKKQKTLEGIANQLAAVAQGGLVPVTNGLEEHD